MRLNRLDLNLFIVFDVIYSERNLTRAAQILSITQPAVSNALSRLRQALNDPLFVRSPQAMMPTPVAENMIGPIREALQLINTSVQQSDTFEPAQAERVFNFSMNDMAEALILPRLMNYVHEHSPNISVSSYQINRRDISKELASGKLDFVIDVPTSSDDNLCHQPLNTSDYVCAVRKDHPCLSSRLTLQGYLAMSHVLISSRRHGVGHVDMILNSMGYSRNIKLRASHYLVAPEVVRRSDLALTLPRSLVKDTDLAVIELPFNAPALNWHLYWHKSADQDQANIWMRRIIMDQLLI